MQRRLLAIATALSTALVVVGALGGCAAKTTGNNTELQSSRDPGSIAQPSPGAKATSPTPSATSTSSALAPLPANALFRISATVTDSNGAKADLVQTVYKPIAPDPADTALLNSQCNYPGQPDFQGEPTWQSQVPNALYLTVDMTATLRPGSPAFVNGATAVLFGFPGAPGAFSGQYGVFEAYCASGYLTVPGVVHGVAPISSTDPVKGPYSWAGPTARAGGYGFSGGGTAPDSPDASGDAVVTNCSVQVSSGAISADSALAAWATTPPPFALGCTYIP